MRRGSGLSEKLVYRAQPNMSIYHGTQSDEANFNDRYFRVQGMAASLIVAGKSDGLRQKLERTRSSSTK
jgi:hypothetical protein